MQTSLVVRPSLRKTKFAAVLCVLFLIFVIYIWRTVASDAHWSFLVIGLVPFIGPALGWLSVKRTCLTVADGLVRHRQGLVAETTRSTELRKIQDIRVERSASQRLWGLGTLVLETSSEQGRITMADIERPQQIADLILDASRKDGTHA